jgi:hypothetical protein
MPIPNFGISWRLRIRTSPVAGSKTVITVATPDNLNDPNNPTGANQNPWAWEPLQIEFEVRQSIGPAGAIGGFWFADVSIYNLNDPTTNILLTQGMGVELEAGFQAGIFGKIFEGTLFQATWERIDGITTKLTLHCIVGIVETTNNFISLNSAAGLTQRQIVARMAAGAAYPLDSSNVNLPDTTTTSRGEVYFNQPDKYFLQVAIETQANFWISNMAVNIRALVDSETVPVLQVSPETGLIGTPQQTQDGVELKILLNPNALLRTKVQLSPNTAINQLVRQQGTFPTILDQKGTYSIAAITHRGNSRGNEWFTYITGITSIGSRLGLQTND